MLRASERTTGAGESELTSERRLIAREPLDGGGVNISSHAELTIFTYSCDSCEKEREGERSENASPAPSTAAAAMCVCMSTNIENNAAVRPSLRRD